MKPSISLQLAVALTNGWAIRWWRKPKGLDRAIGWSRATVACKFGAAAKCLFRYAPITHHRARRRQTAHSPTHGARAVWERLLSES